MNFINFSLQINNYPIRRASKILKTVQKISVQDYNTYVDLKKEYIFNYHLLNNRFYRNFLGVDFKYSNWNTIPVLTKKDFQIHLKGRLSDSFSLNKVYKSKTSGSSGHPFYFAKDKFSHALTWAIIENRFGWFNLNGEKQARFYGLPKKTINRYKELLKDFLLNRKRFDVFDLSDEALQNWLDIFKQRKFVYLNGYTTVILAFANYLISKKIVLKNVCTTLKACVVTSEICFDSDTILLEKAFGVPIINEYGTSELDLIAFQNKEKEWIVNTESLFVEVLDKDNHPVEDGEVGRIVITSLYNKAHPFIRYEIGDVGSIKRCNSKKIILTRLEGRREDLVYLPDGRIAPGLTFYYITKSIMEESSLVKEIKVVQTNINIFEIHYVSNTSFNEDQIEKIKKALSDYLLTDLKLIFYKLNRLERNKSGKLKQFTSLIQK